jgi:hypothetical protein
MLRASGVNWPGHDVFQVRLLPRFVTLSDTLVLQAARRLGVCW